MSYSMKTVVCPHCNTRGLMSSNVSTAQCSNCSRNLTFEEAKTSTNRIADMYRNAHNPNAARMSLNPPRQPHRPTAEPPRVQGPRRVGRRNQNRANRRPRNMSENRTGNRPRNHRTNQNQYYQRNYPNRHGWDIHIDLDPGQFIVEIEEDFEDYMIGFEDDPFSVFDDPFIDGVYQHAYDVFEQVTDPWSIESEDEDIIYLEPEEYEPAPPQRRRRLRIPKFKQIKYSTKACKDQKNCPVWFEEFKTKEKIGVLPCSHMFHPKCLKPWLKHNDTCPVCRKEVRI